jgi:hypothetical protein
MAVAPLTGAILLGDPQPMSSEKARQQFSVMAGVAALTMGVLLTFHLIAVKVMGASILVNNQEFEAFLYAVGEHKHLYTASGVVEALSVACLIPIGLSFIAIFEDDRPYAILAVAFLFIGGALLVDAYAHYGNMVGLAMDLQLHRAPTDLLIKLADTQGDLFEIIQYGGLCGIGAAFVIISVLMLRSEYYPAPMAWMTFAVALFAFFYTVVPGLFQVGQPAWGFVVGSYVLAREAGLVSATEEEPEAA